MERYRVIQIKHDDYQNCYVLQDCKGQEYSIILNFYDFEITLQEGEYLYFSEKIFIEISKYGTGSFYFGGLSDPYGRKVTKDEIKKSKAFINSYKGYYDETISEEIFAIERSSEIVFLKRFYG